MKTTIKITALAVITVLAVLACAPPEVELTARDFGEYRDSKNAAYTNNRGSNLAPYVSNNLYYYSATSLTQASDSQKEITITFPRTADILKGSNSGMATKIKEIFKVYTYNNADTAPTTYVYTPSNLNEISYTFVSGNSASSIITVRLDSVPNRLYIAYKIDTSKYTCSGQLVDINVDGIAGDAYDDIYGRLYVNNGASNTDLTNGWGYTADFYAPVVTVDLSTGYNGGNYTTLVSPQTQLYVQIATGISGSDQARGILNDIKGKIEFQKYTNNKWVKEGDVTVFDSSVTPKPDWAIYWTQDCLYVSYSPEDMGLYRVKATGVANLTSSANIGDKPAKISVNGSFLDNTVYTTPAVLYNSNRNWQTTSPISSVKVSSDGNNKNVVLELYLNSYSYYDSGTSTTISVYPEPLSLEQFNANFKLVYSKGSPNSLINSGNSWNSYNDLVEIKVTNVRYEASTQSIAANDNIDRITVTLDPSYQIDLNSSRAISLLLNHGFKYSGDRITFGAQNNLQNSVYNGTYGWRSYGQLANLR